MKAKKKKKTFSHEKKNVSCEKETIANSSQDGSTEKRGEMG